MASWRTTTAPASQDSKTAILTDVTIVIAGNSRLIPVEPSPDPVSVLHAPHSQPSAVRGEPLAPAAEDADQPAFPPLATQAVNLFNSVVSFVGDGLAVVDDAEYRRRLDVCRTCDRRAGKRCTSCGCWIGLTARGRAFTCPLARWE